MATREKSATIAAQAKIDHMVFRCPSVIGPDLNGSSSHRLKMPDRGHEKKKSYDSRNNAITAYVTNKT
jgi:hypothetical protein